MFAFFGKTIMKIIILISGYIKHFDGYSQFVAMSNYFSRIFCKKNSFRMKEFNEIYFKNYQIFVKIIITL